jgi:hypothetical protein
MTTTPPREVRFRNCGLREHQVFWSERGEIVCACCHLPYPGSDTWIWDRWEEITPEMVIEAESLGHDLSCEGCGKRPSRIVR